MDKVTMDVCPYKGYEIHAVPHQLVDTGDWTIDIQISHETEGGRGWEHFAGNCFKTREEAVAHCFDFGKQIIDGKPAVGWKS